MQENVISINAAINTPSIVNGKVAPPSRKKNVDLRPREYLTEGEIKI